MQIIFGKYYLVNCKFTSVFLSPGERLHIIIAGIKPSLLAENIARLHTAHFPSKKHNLPDQTQSSYNCLLPLRSPSQPLESSRDGGANKIREIVDQVAHDLKGKIALTHVIFWQKIKFT